MAERALYTLEDWNRVVWKQITRNHWTASLPGGVTINVTRNRSWKALRDDKPFKIEVFGNIWVQQHREGYEFLEQAQLGAEDAARKIVRGLAAWAARDTFPKMKRRRNKRAGASS